MPTKAQLKQRAKRLADAKLSAQCTLCLLDISELLHARKSLPELGQQFLDALDMHIAREEGGMTVEMLKTFVRSEKDMYGLTAVDEALLAALHPVFFEKEPLNGDLL